MVNVWKRCAVVCALLFCGVTQALANTVTINGASFAVSDVVVSKSSGARLASMGDPQPRKERRSVYLPAGTKLFLLETGSNNRDKLAISEHGLLMFVRNGVHYFSPKFVAEVYDTHGGEYLAVVREKEVVMSPRYGELTLTPSEIYSAVEEGLGYDIRMTVDHNKIEQNYSGPDTVVLSEGNLALIALPLDPAEAPPTPTTLFRIEEELSKLLANIGDVDLEKLALFKTYATDKLGVSKKCLEELNYGLGLEASAAVEFNAWLSPVEAGLGLTADYTRSTNYVSGRAFRLDRYLINDHIYEVLEEEVECDKVAKDQREITIEPKDRPDRTAKLETVDAEHLGLRTDSGGFLVYTCRNEYLLLEDELFSRGLDEAALRLFLARYTVFRGVRDVATCE